MKEEELEKKVEKAFLDYGFTKTSKDEIIANMFGFEKIEEITDEVLEKNPIIAKEYKKLSNLSEFRRMEKNVCEQFGLICIEVPETECQELWIAYTSDLSDQALNFVKRLRKSLRKYERKIA